LTWQKSTLLEGKDYSLRLLDNKLFNAKGEPIVYTSQRVFSTTPHACTGNGVWNSITTKCDCQMGYDGDNCDKCAKDYVTTLPPPALGCMKDVTNVCKPETCGCKSSGTCDPIGVCSITPTAKAQCQCPSNYNGAHCEFCASGFVNYPLCKRPDLCTPNCVHGECDTTTKTCKCNPNWGGSADCSVCSQGWSGADCSTPVKDDSSSSGFVKFITIAGLVLAVFACFGGAAWFAWFQYKKYNWKRKVSYFPLGLEELENGMELQASTSFRDHEDDDDNAGEKENQKEKKQAADKAKSDSIFDSDDDIPATTPTKTKTTPTAVDNEFNPRARDSKKDSLLNL